MTPVRAARDGVVRVRRVGGGPPGPGWTDRVGRHQLSPLLADAVLFGRGCTQHALTAARTALAE